jgi:hypothetical protein
MPGDPGIGRMRAPGGIGGLRGPAWAKYAIPGPERRLSCRIGRASET